MFKLQHIFEGSLQLSVTVLPIHQIMQLRCIAAFFCWLYYTIEVHKDVVSTPWVRT